MKAKEVGKLLAVSTLSLGIGAGVFNLCACGVYGPMELHQQESESFDPDDNNAVCEYGVEEIKESDVDEDVDIETGNTGSFDDEDPIFAEPVDVYGPAPDFSDFDTSSDLVDETDDYVPSRDEVPAVYGVQESYAQE